MGAQTICNARCVQVSLCCESASEPACDEEEGAERSGGPEANLHSSLHAAAAAATRPATRRHARLASVPISRGLLEGTLTLTTRSLRWPREWIRVRDTAELAWEGRLRAGPYFFKQCHPHYGKFTLKFQSEKKSL